MVGRALQRQVQRHLHALVAGGGDEVVEVVDRAQLRVHGVVAALVAADRPRRADVLGRGGDRVVAALAVHLADRMDRRQVHHVEAHLGDARQRLRRGGERAVHRLALLVHPPVDRGNISYHALKRAAGRSTQTPYCSPRVIRSRNGYSSSSRSTSSDSAAPPG